MARSSHHIVAIEGIEGAGKTTLASALQQELREEYIMVSMDVEAPATDSAEDAAEALLVARFKQHMRPLRTAAQPHKPRQAEKILRLCTYYIKISRRSMPSRGPNTHEDAHGHKHTRSTHTPKSTKYGEK